MYAAFKCSCLIAILLLSFAVPLRAVTCSDTVETPSGLRYIITEKGTGRSPVKGDIVAVAYVGTYTDGKAFDSADSQNPFIFRLGIGKVIKGWDEGISYLKEGDKASFIIPADLAYGNRGSYDGSIPPGATLVFDIVLLEVADGPEPYKVGGSRTEKTPEGLKYIVVEENLNGKQAYSGNTVSVHYTGYFEDGTIFDSSIPGAPYTFVLGDNSTIAGWQIGVRLMKTGDKLRLIVPPKLAYKDKGVPGIIPPDATLIFDVELVEVR